MPTYITLINFTGEGIRNVKDSPQRAQAFRQAAEAAGVRVKEIYWTLGSHDGVLILDAPDDEALSRALLSVGRLGFVRTQTLRAFDRSEFEGILSGVD